MAFSCFWVRGDCVKPDMLTCSGCEQYPYGESGVAPPGVPADFAQQMMGMHVGLAELFAKKGIAKPEELDEAIARNIERLVSQDKMLRDAVCAVDHVVDAMVHVGEPGKLDVYIALDEEGERDRDTAGNSAAQALEPMVPPGTEIRVMVAKAKTDEQPAPPKPAKKHARKTKKTQAKKSD